ncbi:MAG TPA: alpha-hydroxy acid oxidase, partial [Solirubrobacterales bacterium]|nr:alpha-hydroxy acid oxidase [Solirubrobacterales bacterium]
MTAGEDVGELPLSEFEELATARLDPAVLDYVQRGSGDEHTLARNREGWLEVELRPRVLAAVGTPDLSVEVLGKRRATPLFAAPTALNAMVHPDGEAAVARAAATAGAAAYCLSTAAAIDAAELTAAAPRGPHWQQLYLLRDRGVTRDQVAAAAAAGFEALVLTVDTPVLSLRDHDARSGVTAKTVVGGGASTPASPADFVALLDPTLSWDDLAELVADSPLPVIVKGIVRGDDA